MIRTIEPADLLKVRYALAVLAYYGLGLHWTRKESPLKTKARALINHDRALTNRRRIEY